jgi:hypothetical protein
MGAFRRDLGEGCPAIGSYSYVFVAKFAATGALVYSTLLGISRGGWLAVDAQGNAYVTGSTTKTFNFPTTPGAFQTEITGPSDTSAAFVVKLNPQGSALLYSTFQNGANGNYGGFTRLGIDAGGSAYVTGGVSSSDFVTTTKGPPVRV